MAPAVSHCFHHRLGRACVPCKHPGMCLQAWPPLGLSPRHLVLLSHEGLGTACRRAGSGPRVPHASPVLWAGCPHSPAMRLVRHRVSEGPVTCLLFPLSPELNEEGRQWRQAQDHLFWGYFRAGHGGLSTSSLDTLKGHENVPDPFKLIGECDPAWAVVTFIPT